MKHLPLVAFAAAFGLALAVAPAAHAFTFEDQDSTGSGAGAQGFLNPSTPYVADPDARFSGSGSGNGTPGTYQHGNATLQFGSGSGSFDQRYNPNNLFDPYAREGRY
jgi:hypothetical protein